MADNSLEPHLRDIIGAIEHIQSKLLNISLEAFQDDLDRRRIVERNVEIISEASRRLSDIMKSRHPEIPWKKVAGIGNILRHDYENVIPEPCGSWRRMICRFWKAFAAKNSPTSRNSEPHPHWS